MISSSKSSFIVAFAEELRRARDYNGISLSEVAAATRVSLEYLEALEAGRWEDIPQPYLRGFLSLYAKAVGMNVEKVIVNYDRLITAPDDQSSATLDSSSALLPQPERIGVTRAKIRTGWFAAISQNRTTGYIVSALTVLALCTGLYVSRRAQRAQVVPDPFARSSNEYFQYTHGPITYFRPNASDSTESSGMRLERSVIFSASDSGLAIISNPPQPLRIVHFAPYDTLVIFYDSLSYVKIKPAQSAIAVTFSKTGLSPETVVSDTALYVFK